MVSFKSNVVTSFYPKSLTTNYIEGYNTINFCPYCLPRHVGLFCWVSMEEIRPFCVETIPTTTTINSNVCLPIPLCFTSKENRDEYFEDWNNSRLNCDNIVKFNKDSEGNVIYV